MMTEAGFFLLYLFYGLIFFMIGASITSRNLRFSELKIAGFFWIFASFAYLHGLNEWFDLFLRMNHAFIHETTYDFLLSGRVLLLGGSFGLLFWFGLELLLFNFDSKKIWIFLVLLVGVISLGPAIVGYLQQDYSHFDLYLRHFLGLPGALLSGVGLVKFSFSVEAMNRQGAKNLAYAGYAVLLYGFFTGVFPSGFHIAGIPVEVFRTFSALFILTCMMRALQIFDFERQSKIESQLKRFAQSEKLVALGTLSAGVAHEINNPLAKVLLNVELLEKGLGRGDKFDHKQQTRIDIIKRNLERAAKIAGELLFISHNSETEFVTFSLNEVVRKTLQLLGSRQDHYDFEFDLGDVPEVRGLPWKVEEVLLNLLMNAMDATPAGGHIRIATRIEDDFVCGVIEDHGTGISDAHLGSVLDPFFTTKEIGKGTGLGLSVCFGIMKLHGGEILINSKEGQGTTVRLRFPLGE